MSVITDYLRRLRLRVWSRRIVTTVRSAASRLLAVVPHRWALRQGNGTLKAAADKRVDSAPKRRSKLGLRMPNLSIRTKVLGATGFVLCLTGIGMTFVYMRVQSTDDAYKLANDSATAALEASQLRSAFQVEQQQAQNMLIRGADATYFRRHAPRACLRPVTARAGENHTGAPNSVRS